MKRLLKVYAEIEVDVPLEADEEKYAARNIQISMLTATVGEEALRMAYGAMGTIRKISAQLEPLNDEKEIEEKD